MEQGKFLRLPASKQREIEKIIIDNLPAGNLCTISDASGLAKNKIYRIVKHWPSGDRDVNLYNRGVINRYAETQVIAVLEIDVTGKKFNKFGKTTYPTYRIEPIDLIKIGELFMKLNKLIQELIDVKK